MYSKVVMKWSREILDRRDQFTARVFNCQMLQLKRHLDWKSQILNWEFRISNFLHCCISCILCYFPPLRLGSAVLSEFAFWLWAEMDPANRDYLMSQAFRVECESLATDAIRISIIEASEHVCPGKLNRPPLPSGGRRRMWNIREGGTSAGYNSGCDTSR